jgi:hypothetical protein
VLCQGLSIVSSVADEVPSSGCSQISLDEWESMLLSAGITYILYMSQPQEWLEEAVCPQNGLSHAPILLYSSGKHSHRAQHLPNLHSEYFVSSSDQLVIKIPVMFLPRPGPPC